MLWLHMLWVLKRDGSFVCPKHILKLIGKNIFTILRSIILFILTCVVFMAWSLLKICRSIHILLYLMTYQTLNICYPPWADPERAGGPDPPPPLKYHKKYRVSLQYWSGSPENSQSFQASIQCWCTICPPVKHHFNGVSLAGR